MWIIHNRKNLKQLKVDIWKNWWKYFFVTLADVEANYLIIKGISPSRIIAKGYGSTKLLNNCVHGILCLEEDHAVNNRFEIKILSGS